MATTPTDAGAGSQVEPAPGGTRTGPRRHGMTERSLARLFLAPALILMAILGLGPIIYALIESLFAHPSIVDRGEFVGLSNYVDQITSTRFWTAVLVTLAFTAISVSVEFVLGLAFALIMNAAFRGRGVVRATILLPWVIPTAIAGSIWLYLMRINPGYFNTWLGLGNFDWLTGNTAFWAVIIADVWKTAPFVALLLLAGLQTIPGDVYEAARVDGASPWQRFRQITLPLLKPAIVVALLFRSVDALRMFDLSNIMTSNRVETLSVLTQIRIFTDPQPGVANTLSALTFVLIMGLGLLFILARRQDILGEDR